MQQKIAIKLLPSEASDEGIIKHYIAAATGKKLNEITGFTLLKQSIDARGRQVYFNLTVNAFVNEPYVKREVEKVGFRDVSASKRKVIVIGAGPAGLFAAL